MLSLIRYFCLLAVGLPAFAAVTVVDGLSYSTINTSSRLFRVFYSTGTPNSALLPVIVWLHGGGWYGGGRADSASTPLTCKDDSTVACWLADHGYVVFSIDYTLVSTIAAGADLKVTAANTVSTSLHSFTQSDVGSAVNILSTGSWITGGYKVSSVSAGAAILNASPGAIGTSSGQFGLVNGSTIWPAQWQDCKCFLQYLAENAGVTVPGDKNNIVLMGHSSGGHIAGIVGLSSNTAFPGNCDHVSTSYTIRGIVATSPPTDLIAGYTSAPLMKSPIRNLIGCVPNYGTCNTTAQSASIPTYVDENLPPYISFSGAGDTTVPPANVQETSTAFAQLNPTVASTWIELGTAFSHPLDLFYYSNCSTGKEPSPCGSAGSAFQQALPFIQSVTAPH